MITFGADNRGRKVIGIGLTDEDIENLKQGHPITLSLEGAGILNTDILILSGKTEVAIQRTLESTTGQLLNNPDRHRHYRVNLEDEQ